MQVIIEQVLTYYLLIYKYYIYVGQVDDSMLSRLLIWNICIKRVLFCDILE